MAGDVWHRAESRLSGGCHSLVQELSESSPCPESAPASDAAVRKLFARGVGSGWYSRRSAGWHCKNWQMASRVLKRMALARPDLSTDRFCGVMSMAAARSLSRHFRRASMTSRWTMMGIWLEAVRSNRERLFLCNQVCLFHDPSDQANEEAGEGDFSKIELK